MGFSFSFLSSTPKHIITKENVFSTFKLEPKRICFTTCHKNALKKTGWETGPSHALWLPFCNTIKQMFDSYTGLCINQLKNGKYWCALKDDKEKKLAQGFIDNHNKTVFLRDELEISCAISEYCYFEDGIQHCTKMGELEKVAKNDGDEEAIKQLSGVVTEFVKSATYYSKADCICGVPSSKKLPANIASLVASQAGKLTDISGSISFLNEKDEVKKKKDINERWSILEAADLQVGEDNVKGKKIILLDDMYQTGITMQFIAMKLLEAGASNVYGLSLVKAASNSL